MTSRAPIASAALSAVLVSLNAAGALSAQSVSLTKPLAAEASRLVGFVLDDASRQPVPGVFVTLEGHPRGQMTDERGRFAFGDVDRDVDPLKLTAIKLGYISGKTSIENTGATQTLVFLVPDPVTLEGLTVTLDRFERRRRSIPFAMRVFDHEDLVNSRLDPPEFIRQRMVTRTCGDFDSDVCVRSRGAWRRLRLYLNDFPMLGGLGFLNGYPTHLIHSMEVIPECGMVRVYTRRFIERVARTGSPPRGIRNCSL